MFFLNPWPPAGSTMSLFLSFMTLLLFYGKIKCVQLCLTKGSNQSNVYSAVRKKKTWLRRWAVKSVFTSICVKTEMQCCSVDCQKELNKES